MVRLRAAKVEAVVQDVPDVVPAGDPDGDLLIVGWGSTYGPSPPRCAPSGRRAGASATCTCGTSTPPGEPRRRPEALPARARARAQHGPAPLGAPREVTSWTRSGTRRCRASPSSSPSSSRRSTRSWRPHDRDASRVHEEGLPERPGGPLVPRLRRLRDPLRRAVGLPSSGSRERSSWSSRASDARAGFPYYVNTFGFHTIHGRAPAWRPASRSRGRTSRCGSRPATATRSRSAATTRFHMLRRNVGIKVLLFNNRIYGLTKGQYSPTSEVGKKAKSTPYGSLDRPFNPLSLALGRRPPSSPIGRRVPAPPEGGAQEGRRPPGLRVRRGAAELQHLSTTAPGRPDRKDLRDDATIALEHGQPLVFGKGRDKGIRLNGLALEVVTLGGGITERISSCTTSAIRAPPMRSSLAAGRDAGLPDAHRGAARGRRAALRDADRRPGPRRHREEGTRRPREAAARRRHVAGDVTPRNTFARLFPLDSAPAAG